MCETTQIFAMPFSAQNFGDRRRKVKRQVKMYRWEKIVVFARKNNIIPLIKLQTIFQSGYDGFCPQSLQIATPLALVEFKKILFIMLANKKNKKTFQNLVPLSVRCLRTHFFSFPHQLSSTLSVTITIEQFTILPQRRSSSACEANALIGY